MYPRLTIIIPCHNGAALLPTTLRAALGQTMSDLEVVVVDNASTDDTQRIALQFAAIDRRVRVLRREDASAGPAPARALGAAAARGDLLWFLDADDVPHPDVAERAIEELDRQPSVGSVAFATEIIDEHGSATQAPGNWGAWWVPTRFGIRRGRRDDRAVDLVAVLDSACLITSVICTRRTVYEHAGGWRGCVQGYEDQDLALRLVLAAPMQRLPDAVIGYRVHPGQFTAANAHVLDIQRRAFLERWRHEDLPPASRAKLDRAFSLLDRYVNPRHSAAAALRSLRAGRPVTALRFVGGAVRLWLDTAAVPGRSS